MKVAVAGLGWWGKQIISCLDKSPRFEVLYGIDPKPPADVEEFRKSHKFTLDTTPRQGARRSGRRRRGAGDAACAPRGAGAQCHRRRQEPLLREAAHHDRRRREARRRGEHARPARCSASATSGAGSRPSRSCGRWSMPGRSASSSSSTANVSHDNFRKLAEGQLAAQPRQRAGRHDDRGRHPPHRSLHQHRRPAGRGARALDQHDLRAAGGGFRQRRASCSSRACARRSPSLSITPFYGRFTLYGDKGWVEIVSMANVDQGKPTDPHARRPQRPPHGRPTSRPTR